MASKNTRRSAVEKKPVNSTAKTPDLIWNVTTLKEIPAVVLNSNMVV
jgi:hypothetical protein